VPHSELVKLAQCRCLILGLHYLIEYPPYSPISW
jgi:hypothetical protein